MAITVWPSKNNVGGGGQNLLTEQTFITFMQMLYKGHPGFYLNLPSYDYSGLNFRIYDFTAVCLGYLIRAESQYLPESGYLALPANSTVYVYATLHRSSPDLLCTGVVLEYNAASSLSYGIRTYKVTTNASSVTAVTAIAPYLSNTLVVPSA